MESVRQGRRTRAAATDRTADPPTVGSATPPSRPDGLSASATIAAPLATALSVDLTVTYPGGTVVGTSMSRAQFQDALASNDPKAFGAVSGADGCCNGRDAVLVALGLGPAGGRERTMPMQVSPAIAAKATARAFGASAAEIAVAVLRAGAGSADIPENHAAPTTTVRETEIASATLFGVRGTANGVTAAIAFSTVSATTTIVPQDAAPEGVGLVV